MVIDFLRYAEARNARLAALQAERVAEIARRRHLEQFLGDLLSELEVA